MSTPGKAKGGGVLPINAAATKKSQPKQGSRAPGPRLRLIVRRLPPGLVEAEFWSALGEEWLVGKGKVDWASFKDGKVSKEYVWVIIL
jgi:regulator of nonsense transcripts 3